MIERFQTELLIRTVNATALMPNIRYKAVLPVGRQLPIMENGK